MHRASIEVEIEPFLIAMNVIVSDILTSHPFTAPESYRQQSKIQQSMADTREVARLK